MNPPLFGVRQPASRIGLKLSAWQRSGECANEERTIISYIMP